MNNARFSLGKQCTSLGVDSHFETSRHTQEKKDQVNSHLHGLLEEPRVDNYNPFSSRMKLTIHLDVLWHEILPIMLLYFSTGSYIS